MAWDFCTDPAFQEKLDWMRRFVDEELLPLELVDQGLNQKQLDALWAPFKERVKEAGLWAAHLEPEHGGQGMGQLPLALMHEVLGRSMIAPEIFGNQAPDSGNAELIAVGADAAQKKRWLEPLLAGRVRSSFALTEPHNAGSDPTGITTRCERDGESWVLNGHKWYASNASVADFLVVMAVTHPEAPPHKRAAMVIVPRGTPGMTVVRDIGTMADPEFQGDNHQMDRVGGHSELLFENCRVPLDHMIGAPGEGFVLAQKRLGGGRIHHAMRMIGQCRRAFDMMCERAASRPVRGRRLGDQQLVQDMIACSAVDLESARLLTLQAAWMMDREGASSGAARKHIAMVKLHVAQVLYNVLDRAIQVHGSLGYSTDLPLESMYRMARALRLADGADEVHKLTIARQVLKGVQPVEGWPSEHIPTRRRAAREKFRDLLEHVLANR